ncbi:methyl-accepting chemotaxis protein [Citrobacter braakii]|uniref:methyl-accepting chemotaxis protein n=1 Tax=Citrobacter braakii TaxID=57706 RepID=UPI000CDDD31F|nr:methyl-accepting chemotaxis protein [Citrobacter braakii]POT31607.1 chemotaxis protein [Citrobacter braakii]POT36422.1 chemotaxis protein [Citrobacter braakii]POT41247.1 chemotaxis protein [Citrobacter braakii]POU82789.1 chemotaxis protein [Citrobacter braakii]POV12684.1 chemotaxis protein [Citrobacter braakii]
MWWVYRMPMKMKLIIALQPLLLALCWFAGSGILTRIETERQMENIAQLTALARSAGNVVHELQKERGMSVGFLGAEGKTFKDELTAQRALTDREIEVFVRSLSDTALPEGDAANSVTTFKKNILSLATIRENVTRLGLPASDVVKFYTNVIADVLSFVGRLGQLTDSGEMANAFAAYYNLLNLKEQAGIERALLSNIFSSGHFAEGQLHQLSDVVSKQNVWLAQSLRLSPPEQAAMLESRLQSTEASKALSLRETAFSHAANGGFDVDPTVWFKVQTQRIEVMRQIEDVTANLLLANAEKLAQDARKNWQRYMIVSLLALLASLAFAGAIAINMHRQFSDTLRKIAGMNGDLTQRLATPGKDELSSLNRAYNTMLESIQHIVQEIKQGSVVLSDASSSITAGNQDLAQRTDEQAASIVQAVASMEQRSTTITQTADNAREAEQLTIRLEKEVRQASNVASAANQSMGDIRSSSEKISNIVTSIDDISFQTNLLALNAAVEAARAGEMGRGFAVVASEVRNLSQRCAKEANQIRELVAQNMVKISEGVERVTASATALEAAADNTTSMKQYIADIARVATEQSQGVTQINLALRPMEQVTQQNAALVSQAASDSQRLDNLSVTMKDLVNRFVV